MSVKKCQNCGYENDSTMNFCLECGMQLVGNPLSAAKTEVLPATERSVPTVELPKKKSRKYYWIFGGLVSLLIFALLGLGGILFLASRVGKDDASIKTPVPAASPIVKTSPTADEQTQIPLSNTSVETSKPEETTAPNPRFTPPTKPTARGVFNVEANKNWQLSNLDVVPNEKFVLLGMGSINLREIGKGVSPEGIADRNHQSRRLFP